MVPFPGVLTLSERSYYSRFRPVARDWRRGRRRNDQTDSHGDRDHHRQRGREREPLPRDHRGERGGPATPDARLRRAFARQLHAQPGGDVGARRVGALAVRRVAHRQDAGAGQDGRGPAGGGVRVSERRPVRAAGEERLGQGISAGGLHKLAAHRDRAGAGRRLPRHPLRPAGMVHRSRPVGPGRAAGEPREAVGRVSG